MSAPLGLPRDHYEMSTYVRFLGTVRPAKRPMCSCGRDWPHPNYTPPPSPPDAIEYGDPGLRSLARWLRGKPSLRTGRLPWWKR